MQRRQRHRQNMTKEIILPENEKPGPSQTCLKNVSDLGSDDFNKKKGITKNTASSCLKIGSHEVKSVGRLVNLEKKAQEPYVYKQSGKKKSLKKKVRHHRVKQSVNELLLEESQNKTEESEIQTPSIKSLSFEEIIERKKLQQKIRDYEKFKNQSDRKNQIKQRLAEQKYIEKYENLAETWLELIKRRNQLKQEGFNYLKPPHKECYNKRITISIISRKYWNNDEDVKPEKVQEKCKSKQKETKEIEDLGEGIVQKLVFVDDESNEDLESSYCSRKKT